MLSFALLSLALLSFALLSLALLSFALLSFALLSLALLSLALLSFALLSFVLVDFFCQSICPLGNFSLAFSESNGIVTAFGTPLDTALLSQNAGYFLDVFFDAILFVPIAVRSVFAQQQLQQRIEFVLQLVLLLNRSRKAVIFEEPSKKIHLNANVFVFALGDCLFE